MNSKSATFMGMMAIISWAMLTFLGVSVAGVPPFQLLSICFLIGGVIGLLWAWWKGDFPTLRTISMRYYAFGCFGIFGYHFLFFTAIRLAPAAEVSLVNYSWPLLIVLFSGLLPNERLRFFHAVGALVAFLGTALLVSGGAQLSAEAWLGYFCGFLAALAWSSYSVVSRLLGSVPTSAVAIYCVFAAILSAICHLIFETTVWPETTFAYVALIALGLGPVGGAFFVWDIGMKWGNVQLLGTLAYIAPLASTCILIMAGIAEPTPVLLSAAVLITSGALLAAFANRLNFFRMSKGD